MPGTVRNAGSTTQSSSSLSSVSGRRPRIVYRKISPVALDIDARPELTAAGSVTAVRRSSACWRAK